MKSFTAKAPRREGTERLWIPWRLGVSLSFRLAWLWKVNKLNLQWTAGIKPG